MQAAGAGAEAPVGSGLRRALDALAARAEASGGRMAVVVCHHERGQRYERRAAESFVAASVIKLAVLVAAHAAAAEGRLPFHRWVRLRPEDQVTGSGVLQLLSPGLRLPVRDLVELMIAQSDNAATNMLLERIGLDAVARLLEGAGLRGTRLRRPLQVVPAGPSEPNVTTAADTAALLRLIADGRAVSFEASRRMVATLKRQQVAHGLPALLPDPRPPSGFGVVPRWELAHKTGGVPGYQHDAGLLYLPGQTVTIAVLTQGCGSASDARATIARVGLAVFRAFGDRGAGRAPGRV